MNFLFRFQVHNHALFRKLKPTLFIFYSFRFLVLLDNIWKFFKLFINTFHFSVPLVFIKNTMQALLIRIFITKRINCITITFTQKRKGYF